MTEFVFDSLLNSESGRFGRLGRPIEPSAPEGRGVCRLRRDSRFHLQNSFFGSLANLLALLWKSTQCNLCCQAPDSSSCFSTGNLLFASRTLKPTVLKNTVFDQKMCFCPCEVYRNQNLVGFES